MIERKLTASACLVQTGFLGIRGDYVGAIQAVYQGLCDDPQNAALRKKHEELLSVICWRC